MKLYNNSSEFTIRYNNFDFVIPNGWFEVKTDTLKQFIVNKAKIRWGIDILESEPVSEKVVENTVSEEKAVIEDVKKEVVENEIKKEENKIEIKKVKKSQKIADLENSL
jgi:hypothetical protein